MCVVIPTTASDLLSTAHTRPLAKVPGSNNTPGVLTRCYTPTKTLRTLQRNSRKICVSWQRLLTHSCHLHSKTNHAHGTLGFNDMQSLFLFFFKKKKNKRLADKIWQKDWPRSPSLQPHSEPLSCLYSTPLRLSALVCVKGVMSIPGSLCRELSYIHGGKNFTTPLPKSPHCQLKYRALPRLPWSSFSSSSLRQHVKKWHSVYIPKIQWTTSSLSLASTLS